MVNDQLCPAVSRVRRFGYSESPLHLDDRYVLVQRNNVPHRFREAAPCQLFNSPLPGTVVRCLSREAPPPGGFEGRVSQAIIEQTFDPASTEFYLCGSAAMVGDCRDELERRGAGHIHIESY